MSWSNQKLGEYCEVIAGQSPEGKYYNDSGDGLPFYQGKKEFGDRYIGAPQKWTTKVTKKAKAGDILMSVRAPVGPINFSTENICIGRGLAAIRPSDKLDKYFLFYYLLSKQDEIQGSEGAVFASINKSQIEGLNLLYVGLEEQKRIVAILDQAFADIDIARALTEQNLKNARELFESKKLELFDNLGSTSGLQTLPDVCDEIFAGGDAPEKGLYSKERTDKFNIPIYANAVKNNGLYGYTDYSRANKPSITIAARGSGTGHIELREEPFLPIVRLIVLTPKEDIVSLEYLKHALQTLDILRSGSAIPQLTVPMIKEYSIPVPDFDVQQKVVYELRELDALIERIIIHYQHKAVLLEELQKSLLHKAFSGEFSKGDKAAA